MSATLTAERLKAIRLEMLVRRHGGFLLITKEGLRLCGKRDRMPVWLVHDVIAFASELARFLKYSYEVQCRSS